MSVAFLRRIPADRVQPIGQAALDEATLRAAGEIVQDVRRQGEAALRAHAERLGDIAPGAPLMLDRAELDAALNDVAADTRALLERTAERIRAFAVAQRACLSDLTIEVPGGHAGHAVAPVEAAGCYAPGGRFPLPSSVLMTAVTARAAGVPRVVVASPRPTAVTRAAAAVAGADCLLAAGGAQAVAAMAYGAGPVPRCDVIVGPGNRWVTAAKKRVAGDVAIDMLAGPSELVVVADESADAELVAADLLAQAEHDPDAVVVLVALAPAGPGEPDAPPAVDVPLLDAVEAALAVQLADLPTVQTARASLATGFAVAVRDVAEAVAVCDRLAPEHLALHVRDAEHWRQKLAHYGALFIGARSAEVLGDYGIGPNHVLPTGGTARVTGGLSVFDFLRIRTWLRVDDRAGADTTGDSAAVAAARSRTGRTAGGDVATAGVGRAGGNAVGGGESLADVARDAAALARLEGLEAHARSAERRG